ncbi:MAG: hypothetical protein KatS3mg017_0549 [Fimbriimonadales bacterium]|nr:MAG: hypothetical protein KatS3mg017_0549 [Fimbriimonadales bacterium]
MSFDWSEFLSLAKHLQGLFNIPYSEEAAARTAVSRAYYAAFCCVRNYAEVQFDFRRTATGRDHRLLRKHLQNIDSDWLEIAGYLTDLATWRHCCDYDDKVEGLDKMAPKAIETAKEIIQRRR